MPWVQPQKDKRQKKKEDIEQPENKGENGSTGSSFINNDPKYKWIEFTNQKTEWLNDLKKKDPTTCCLQETQLRRKDK